MSYTNLVYHIVFRTYRSIPAIDEEHERELYAYAHGYITRHRAKLYRIGGMPDHVHLLVSLPPDLAVSEFVRGLKYATNSWLKGNASFPLFAGWGEGYAAFTLSVEQIPVVKQYIINQKETMGSPRGDRGLYSAPRRGGCPRYASEIRPSGVIHRATRWVVSLIAEHTVLQMSQKTSDFTLLKSIRGGFNNFSIHF